MGRRKWLNNFIAAASHRPLYEPTPAMVYINGARFVCPVCRASVFTDHGDYTYTCNGCGAEFEGEPK